MTCVRVLSRIARNSTRILQWRSMVPTEKVPRSPRESWINSGFGACKPASRMPMKASRPSPRLISPKISRSSMSQLWLCMVRTIRSFPSKTQLRNQPGSSKARRKSTILVRLMASRPLFRIRSTPTCCPS